MTWYYIETSLMMSDHCLTLLADGFNVMMIRKGSGYLEARGEGPQLWRLELDSGCLINKLHPDKCLTPSLYQPYQVLMLRERNVETYGEDWQKWRAVRSSGWSSKVILESMMSHPGDKWLGKYVMDVLWYDYSPLMGNTKAGVKTRLKDSTLSQKFYMRPSENEDDY